MYVVCVVRVQAFWMWRDAVRALKFRARQRFLARYALLLSPVFSKSLLSIRRITLAVSSDPAGTWRKTPSEWRAWWHACMHA